MKPFLSDFFPQFKAGAIVAYARRSESPQIESYGFANISDRTPLTKSHVFDLASVGKTFTGAALALLYQRGEFNPKLPLESYLPNLKCLGASRNIIIQDLIWHISDIPDFLDHFSEENLQALTNDDVIEFAVEHAKKCQPGLKYEYSNTNYALLASIIEVISGQSYSDFLRKELFKPLGLDHTHLIEPPKKIRNRVKGYQKKENDVFVESQLDLQILGGGGVFSTVHDLVKWSQVYLQERKLLTDDTSNLVITSGKTDSGEPVGYGWGFYIDLNTPPEWFAHGGRWNGVSTFLQYYPLNQITLVVLSNQYDLPTYDVAQAYLQRVLRSN